MAARGWTCVAWPCSPWKVGSPQHGVSPGARARVCVCVCVRVCICVLGREVKGWRRTVAYCWRFFLATTLPDSPTHSTSTNWSRAACLPASQSPVRQSATFPPLLDAFRFFLLLLPPMGTPMGTPVGTSVGKPSSVVGRGAVISRRSLCSCSSCSIPGDAAKRT